MDTKSYSLMQSFSKEFRAARQREETIKIAAAHGVTLVDSDVTTEVRQHWINVDESEFAEKMNVIAKQRRSLVWRAAVNAVPTQYRSVTPIDALGDDAKRKDMARTIKYRVKDTAAYKATIEAAQSIATGHTSTVLFSGVTGAGKSTLASILVQSIALQWHKKWKAGITGRRPTLPDGDPTFANLMCTNRHDEAFTGCILWTTAREIVAAQKKGEYARFTNASILVIDDIGGEPSQSNIGGVDEIVWARHDEGDRKVTILTSGFCDPSEESTGLYLAPLTNRYSVAFTRRVAEAGRAKVIRCNVKEVA